MGRSIGQQESLAYGSEHKQDIEVSRKTLRKVTPHTNQAPRSTQFELQRTYPTTRTVDYS
jgi:hypothetical protein